MRHVCAVGLATLALALAARGDDLKSGPEKRAGGSFQVKAISGDNKGKTLCYV